LLAAILSGAASLALAQDFYENGSLELQVFRPGGDQAFLTITRRDGFQPAEHLGTALPLTLEGKTGATPTGGQAEICVHFGEQTALVTATGTLPHDVPATSIAGAYHLKTPLERLAAAKGRAQELDLELNRVYDEVVAKLGPKRMPEVRDLQREWIRFAYEAGDASAAAQARAEYWQTRADRAAERIQFLNAYSTNSPTANEQELHAQLQSAEAAEAWPAVAEIARRILAGSLHDSAMWEKRARAFALSADWPRCETTLDDWEATVTPRPPVIDALRGDVAWAADKTDEAVHRWMTFLKTAPKDTDVRDKLAVALAKLEDFAGAAAVLEQRVKIAPTAEAYENLAIDYALVRDWKKTSASARRGSQIDATDEIVKSTLPRVERLEKALPDLKNLDRAVAAAPNDPNPKLDRGLLFARVGWPEIALQEAKMALEANPESRRALLQKASALLALQRKDEAEALEGVRLDVDPITMPALLPGLGGADAALSKNGPSVDALARRAEFLNLLAQYILAEKDSAAALKLDEKSEAALTAHGEALMGTGEDWTALPELTQATEINPQNGHAWFLRGSIESKHRNFAAATDALSHALELQPNLHAALELREKNYRAIGKIEAADSDAMLLKTLKK
jgi:tetratricopeptide (TPR) repeat protein